MTGPEHYRKAENLIRAVKDGHSEGTDVANIVAAAQVHATLALAAATALNDTNPNGSGMPGTDYLEWQRVAGTTEQDGAA